MNTLKRAVRQLLRPRGWELRQYDPDLSLDTFLWMLFEKFGINCVLDVGARVGAYGVLLRNNGYQGHILSFEPVKANFDRLQETCAGDPAWRAFHYALGSTNGVAEINVSRGTNYSSFLAPSKYGAEFDDDIAVARTEPVEVKRLDAILKEVTAHIAAPRVYLKMDTQGFDLEVFRGASGCLHEVVALQSELSLLPLYEGMTGWTAALDEFTEAGYAISGMFAGVRDDRMRLCEMDCVMVRGC
jgi:FkbM family methyltransferase